MSPSVWLETFGRLHVAVVHFPIALILIAALIEAWQGIRGKGRNSATVMLLVFGLLAAGVSIASGWYLNAYQNGSSNWASFGSDVKSHFIAGIIATAFTLLALLAMAFRQPAFGRTMVFLAAIGVGVTGHLGGEMVHGKGYLTELLFPSKPAGAPVVATTGPTTGPSVELVTVASNEQAEVEYEAKVKPILAKSCFECHGPAKHSASLRLDTLSELHAGSKSGVVIVSGKSDESLLIQRVLGLGGKKRMPPSDHDPLTPEQITVLRDWIDKDRTAPTVVQKKFIAVVEPTRPKVQSPIDVLLDPYYTSHNIEKPALVDDRTFARRAYLDVVGILPRAEELIAFEADKSPDKRRRLVRSLLDDDRRYAENWMTFWNDCLRNDYQGTGYIDGGRKQITQWLYKALSTNMPFNEFVSELISPVAGSEGFVNGIVWRGAVSESQRPEMQAAQNISQVFLGMNMKCASCHDSFINDLKLSDAYGMASVFSNEPMKMYRCEKDTGKVQGAAFIFPQVGQINANTPKEGRQEQLAELMTSPDNGRLPRTIVNRLWARFMGRGLVEPVDEMDNEPWNTDVLNWLASDLMDNGYDLKHTIMTILTSDAYQLPSVGMQEPSQKNFVFRGPVVRRMSAEQFCDSVHQLTGGGYVSAAPAIAGVTISDIPGNWVWNTAGALTTAPGGPIYLEREFDLDELPLTASIAVVCDNKAVVKLNGQRVINVPRFRNAMTGDAMEFLRPGKNVLSVRAVNTKVPDATVPNPAGLWLVLSMKNVDGRVRNIATDRSWRVPASTPKSYTPQDLLAGNALLSMWTPAAECVVPDVRRDALAGMQRMPLSDYRAVWAKSDPLMLALGRPNREQTVTDRPSAATTLQALELTNGETLNTELENGGRTWMHMPADSTDERITKLYESALSRAPSAEELETATGLAGETPTPEGMSDLLWAIFMMPEFQLIY